jgi:hypothetical protein
MSILRGNLQSISLTDVVQLLHVNRKTGKLQVTQGKLTGTLYVVNGDVVHAETPQVLGESAAFDILEWDKGEFEFVATRFKAPTTIKRSVQDLLMEAAHTTDSRRHLRGIFPNLHAVPWPTVHEPHLTAGLRLYNEDRRVLPFLDGYRTFLEVMASSEQSEVSVLQTCATLKGAGRLALLEPNISVSVVPLKTGLFKRGGHVELSKEHEAQWLDQGPYGANPISAVRIIWPDGLAVEQVQFVKGMAEHSLGIPKELMQSWGLPEGMFVTVRPTP